MLTMTNADGTRLIRVMLVDNQTLILDGFARIVDAQPDMSVIATATDGETAIRTAHQAKPDVILMDVRMPGLDGIQTTRVIIHDMPEPADSSSKTATPNGSSTPYAPPSRATPSWTPPP